MRFDRETFCSYMQIAFLSIILIELKGGFQTIIGVVLKIIIGLILVVMFIQDAIELIKSKRGKE